MARTFHVGVRGESYNNADGTSRQAIIKRLRAGDRLELIADPLNPHDRWAVGVFTEGGEQIGFLPSDARDASAILKGEPIAAVVAEITGGTTWFKRVMQGKKSVGVVLKLTKGDPDWSRHARLTELAKPYDDAVTAATKLEKSGNTDDAIAAYRKVIAEIASFTESDRFASAHRREAAPIDRLSLLLERRKHFAEALDVVRDWQSRFDPVQPTSSVRESMLKREKRLRSKLDV